MKSYYARPITHYGTQIDNETINTLKKMGMHVVDPNQEIYLRAYKRIGMDAFLDVVSKCDLLFFKSFSNGNVTAGVQKEIQKAIDLGIPVFEVNPFIDTKRKLSVDDTRKAIKSGIK